MVLVHDALHAPVTRYPASNIVRAFTATLIVVNVAVVVIESVQTVALEYTRAFFGFEVASVAVFTLEYMLRVWSSPLSHPELPAWRARLRYMFTFFGLVDLLAIAPFYLQAFFVSDMRVVRAMRLLRLERLLMLGRYTKGFQMLGRAIRRTRHELYASFGMIFIALLISSTLIFYVEHDSQPDKFSSIPESLWWGVVTLTSVGYGDVFPITPLGKLLGGVIALLGVGLAALPAGIIAGGFLDEFRRGDDDDEVPEGHVRCTNCGTCVPIVDEAPETGLGTGPQHLGGSPLPLSTRTEPAAVIKP